MSYHGPRDNGEDRPAERAASVGSEPQTRDVARSTFPSVPIPVPLRSAWGLSTSDESSTPEITGTNPSNPSIIQLLTRPDRSRSPPAGLAPPSGSSTTGHSSSLPRGPIFRPGTFGLQPDIEQATIRMETAIMDAFRVTPAHLVRSHVRLILSHHAPNSPISERLAEFATSRDDPIDDV